MASWCHWIGGTRCQDDGCFIFSSFFKEVRPCQNYRWKKCTTTWWVFFCLWNRRQLWINQVVLWAWLEEVMLQNRVLFVRGAHSFRVPVAGEYFNGDFQSLRVNDIIIKYLKLNYVIVCLLQLPLSKCKALFTRNVCMCVCVKRQKWFYGNKWCSHLTLERDSKEQRKT